MKIPQNETISSTKTLMAAAVGLAQVRLRLRQSGNADADKIADGLSAWVPQIEALIPNYGGGAR